MNGRELGAELYASADGTRYRVRELPDHAGTSFVEHKTVSASVARLVAERVLARGKDGVLLAAAALPRPGARPRRTATVLKGPAEPVMPRAPLPRRLLAADLGPIHDTDSHQRSPLVRPSLLGPPPAATQKVADGSMVRFAGARSVAPSGRAVCPQCGRVLASADGVLAHTRAKHGLAD